jgi:hypothetical protein
MRLALHGRSSWNISPESAQSPQAAPARTVHRIGNAPPGTIEARIYGLLKFVHGAPVGQRNGRLYWAACRIRDMVRARELDSTTGDQAFEELRQIGLRVGLSNPEVVRTIKSAAWGRNAA